MTPKVRSVNGGRSDSRQPKPIGLVVNGLEDLATRPSARTLDEPRPKSLAFAARAGIANL
jgi:hypothetical protein